MERPHFDNKQDFIDYLNDHIENLKEEGLGASAEDFEEALYWLSKEGV